MSIFKNIIEEITEHIAPTTNDKATNPCEATSLDPLKNNNIATAITKTVMAH
jgi:hypothetical protein